MTEDEHYNQIIKSIKDQPTAPQYREAARAQLDIILAEKAYRVVSALTAELVRAREQLESSAQAATQEVGRFREVMQDASRSTSQQAAALVTWTRGLVFVTALYVI